MPLSLLIHGLLLAGIARPPEARRAQDALAVHLIPTSPASAGNSSPSVAEASVPRIASPARPPAWRFPEAAPSDGGDEHRPPAATNAGVALDDAARAAAPTIKEEQPARLLALAYLDNPRPEYPPAARRRGIEGRAVVRVRVGADGEVLTVDLEQTSGSELLDRAALGAIQTWRFVPARYAGVAMEALAIVPVSFRLNRN